MTALPNRVSRHEPSPVIRPRGSEHAEVGGHQILVDRTQAPGQLLGVGRALAECVEQAQVERSGDQLQPNPGQTLTRSPQPRADVPTTQHLGQHSRVGHSGHRAPPRPRSRR